MSRIAFICPNTSDPSIRALILNIDSKFNDIVIEVRDKMKTTSWGTH